MAVIALTSNYMEERKIILEPVIWWGIDAKNEVKEYDSPKRKTMVLYWIKQTDVGIRNTTSYGNTYYIYQFEIFDLKQKNAEIVFNNWKIRRIYDPLGKNAFNWTKVEYVDPTGSLRTIEVRDIKDALKKLYEISEYEDWQYYDLKVLNDKLTVENERLIEVNEELQSKVDAFKNTRLYKRMSSKVGNLNKSRLKQKETHKLFNKQFSVNSDFIRQWFRT